MYRNIIDGDKDGMDENREMRAFMQLPLDHKLWRLFQTVRCVESHERRIRRLEIITIVLGLAVFGFGLFTGT